MTAFPLALLYTHYFYLVVFLINLAFIFLCKRALQTATNKSSVQYFLWFFGFNTLSWVGVWLIETDLAPLSLHFNVLTYILTHWCIFMAINALAPHPALANGVSVFSGIALIWMLMLNQQIAFYDFVSLYSLPIDIAGFYILKQLLNQSARQERDTGLILILIAIGVELCASIVQLAGGWLYPEQTLAYRLPMLTGTLTFFLVSIGFITSVLTQDKQRITLQSQRDPLTNVLNRRGLEASIAMQLSKHETVSLIMLDIDHFKQINDRYGHDAGDFVLQSFSRLISQNIRKDDLFSRIGGEEFVLLLPHTTGDIAAKIADKLRQKIEQCEFHFQQQPIQFTCSLGIAHSSQNFDLQHLVKQADTALYQAKHNGRNRVEVFA
ncbi:GGDEF domain-containing protein [Shewanella acanthi]|uniref:GGDEF domain-containing protein n=1 Tax=Shewanella acanthi TaxID=2864212 RepID=UPI001C65892C|nr:GGDEF domain-containing protein [Shewanella acanthi]QYJ80276.1 GGDEF domain-containing protein [Shewanella acanthi]